MEMGTRRRRQRQDEDVDRATSVRPSKGGARMKPVWRLGPTAQRSKHRKEVSVMNHKVVSQEDWLAARKELLVKDKEFLPSP